MKISEARRSGVTYVATGSTKAKTAAGQFNRVSIKLGAWRGRAISKLAKKFAKIDKLNKQLNEIRDEANDYAKEQLASLFDDEDRFYTRYVETAALAVTLSKDVEEITTKRQDIDYKAVFKELYTLVDSDLEPIIKELLKKHTSISTKVRASQAGRISVKLPESVQSSLSSFLGKFSKFITNLLNSYDAKLYSLTSKVAALTS